ncbi:MULTISPECIES: hypothetical protein [Streptosporangium]|uniref:DUF2569 domain-containing protein n=1 Tax=Streptosporangium brasiliense TaxID=47480 RepID=A0ABT9R4Q1_9ACTN|nr:hypothetical protein [Streptosporangium brasiliense]MDP9863872.1 hypothetical protein [Streptosporangium brasiliense]
MVGTPSAENGIIDAENPLMRATITASGVLAACAAIAAVVDARFLLISWGYLDQITYFSALILITPALLRVLHPQARWQRCVLASGALWPLASLVCLQLYGSYVYMDSWSPIKMVSSSMGVWFVVIGCMTWRHSKIAALAILMTGSRSLLSILLYTRTLWGDADRSDALLSVLAGLNEVSRLTFVFWAAWIAYRLLIHARRDPPTRARAASARS